MIRSTLVRVPGALLAFFAVIVASGCDDSGPKRYDVSGKATFNGKAIPVGEIYFEPDASKGGSGPQGLAKIKDGTYATEPGKGVVGGAYKVRIIGYDGKPVMESGEELPMGTPLFSPYETTVEFSEETTTKDFDVPAMK